MRTYSHAHETTFRRRVRALRAAWERWQRFVAEWGSAPYDEKLVADMKAETLLYIDASRMRPENKDRWRAAVEAACASQPEQEQRDPRRYPHPDKVPTWRGPNGDQPERKIVGLSWCANLNRWAIRIRTTRGEYRDTDIDAFSLDELAIAIDHMKCVLTLDGYFSLQSKFTRKAAWNDADAAQADLACGVTLNPDNVLHTRLRRWMDRVTDADELNAESSRSGRIGVTLRDIPR